MYLGGLLQQIVHARVSNLSVIPTMLTKESNCTNGTLSRCTYSVLLLVALMSLAFSSALSAQDGDHGLGTAKGCSPSTINVGDAVLCRYALANNQDTGDGQGNVDTLTISALEDNICTEGIGPFSGCLGPVSSGDILPVLTWTFTGGAFCNSGTNTNCTLITLPPDALAVSNYYSHYNAQPGDPNPLEDRAFITWQDLCTSGASNCPGGDLIRTEGASVNIEFPARFIVTKDFSDDNPASVAVHLTCNTGLPLEQSFLISDMDAAQPMSDGSVTFVVTSFEDGAMDCTVTETPVDGYTSEFLADGNSDNDNGTEEAPACRFFNVGAGDVNSCEITNSLNPKEVHVIKEWILEENSADFIDPAYQLVLFCNGEILEGTPEGPSGLWYLELYDGNTLGTADQDFQPDVYPNWDGGTVCWVNETVYASSVETSNGCGTETAPGLVVEIDGPEPSCTITNTVFFEGIPTLSAHGLALLALLMLGVGFVGFRRLM